MSTELQTAKEKAKLYQTTKDNTLPSKQSETPTQDSWLDIVDKRVTEAMHQGVFDNLSGQGEPLDFSEEELVPDDKRLAYKLLKNNNLTPAWIGERSEVQRDIEKWRTASSTQFKCNQREWQTASTSGEKTKIQKLWADYLTQQQEKIQELNRKITALNLQQSIASLEIFHLRIDEELEKLGISNSLGSL